MFKIPTVLPVCFLVSALSYPSYSQELADPNAIPLETAQPLVPVNTLKAEVIGEGRTLNSVVDQEALGQVASNAKAPVSQAGAAPSVAVPASNTTVVDNTGSKNLSPRQLVTAQVEDILKHMSRAVHEVDYQGVATYEYASFIDSFKVFHKVVDGVESERLLQLNGAEREVVRRGRDLSCVAVGDQLMRGAALRLGDKFLTLGDFYRYSILGLHRIAGRDAAVIQITPLDEFRYGYLIAVDRATYLPLMMELLGPKLGTQNNVLERFQFVDIKIGDVDLADVQAQSPAAKVFEGGDITSAITPVDGLVGSTQAAQNVDTVCAPKQKLPERWKAAWLPAGFVFSGQKPSGVGGDLLMYTDGLNALSVFVSPIDGSVLPAEGQTRRGATSVFLTKLTLGRVDYSVTVIGELPSIAIERIAQSVRPIVQ